MRIFVDADACPVKEIIVRIARQKDIPVFMLADFTHVIHDGYSTVISVDKGRDSVDIALINRVSAGDIVVTQDYGLAAMVLGKGAQALHHSGMVYTSENMDELLFKRHIGQKIRRSGGRAKGPRPHTTTDDESFLRSLLRVIDTEQQK
jgi:uncharacterized protein YaiI (UPF0178 family)